MCFLGCPQHFLTLASSLMHYGMHDSSMLLWGYPNLSLIQLNKSRINTPSVRSMKFSGVVQCPSIHWIKWWLGGTQKIDSSVPLFYIFLEGFTEADLFLRPNPSLGDLSLATICSDGVDVGIRLGGGPNFSLQNWKFHAVWCIGTRFINGSIWNHCDNWVLSLIMRHSNFLLSSLARWAQLRFSSVPGLTRWLHSSFVPATANEIKYVVLCRQPESPVNLSCKYTCPSIRLNVLHLIVKGTKSVDSSGHVCFRRPLKYYENHWDQAQYAALRKTLNVLLWRSSPDIHDSAMFEIDRPNSARVPPPVGRSPEPVHGVSPAPLGRESNLQD